MDLHIDEEKNIAHIKLSGQLSKKAILSAFDLAVADERYKNGMGGYGISEMPTYLLLILLQSWKWRSIPKGFRQE